MKELEWKYPKIDGYPKKLGVPCFIDVHRSIQIAYWRDDANEWDNPVYGWLPRIYDDEGEYAPEVVRWAYVPDGMFDEYIPCSAYQPNYYIKGDACFGTKEREPCGCGGDKSKCDFY